ncbi:CesT family type III secretion system chaperone [Embleya sp. NBC_00896]|uniref:CesT family type III secretion system chaperone n=1 Tax=Embleya sp. NBC_00896 TaxID=2975961 RepID=UPI00386BCBB5|nr:type III secretion system chaperone [Embleya sp. NBC_00896]
MPSPFFDQLLTEFCRRNRLREEAFDEDGFCVLINDGDRPLLLRVEEAETRLSLYLPVRSRISGDNSGALLPAMKRQAVAATGITRQSGPALVPQAPWMLGYLDLPAAHLSVETLEKTIEEFIHWSVGYR